MKHDQSYVEKDFKVIGTRVPRPDGIDKVTGRAKSVRTPMLLASWLVWCCAPPMHTRVSSRSIYPKLRKCLESKQC